MTAGSRRRASWAARALVVLGLLLAAVLRVAWFGVADRSPDEQLYAGFARGINAQGLAWFPHMVALYTTGGDVEYPWVHRAGFLSLVALAQRASGRHDAVAGEILSTVASLAGIALAGALAWQLVGPLAASLAVLFLAVSPLDLAIARRAWQDTTLAFLTLGMLALALRSLAAARPWRWRVAFCALSAFTLLVKESALIPFGLGVLVLGWDAARHRERRIAALGPLITGAVTLAVVLGVLLALCGGAGPARELARLTPEAWKPDDYLREYQTGGVGYYVTGLRILQPVPWLLGLVAALLALVRPRELAGAERSAARSTALRLVGGYTLVFLGVACAYGSKNMRFLSPLYAPVAILAAAAVSALAGGLRARLPRTAGRIVTGVLAALLVASAVADAKRFDHYFNELQIQDLATPWFTKADAGKL